MSMFEHVVKSLGMKKKLVKVKIWMYCQCAMYWRWVLSWKKVNKKVWLLADQQVGSCSRWNQRRDRVERSLAFFQPFILISSFNCTSWKSKSLSSFCKRSTSAFCSRNSLLRWRDWAKTTFKWAISASWASTFALRFAYSSFNEASFFSRACWLRIEKMETLKWNRTFNSGIYTKWLQTHFHFTRIYPLNGTKLRSHLIDFCVETFTFKLVFVHNCNSFRQFCFELWNFQLFKPIEKNGIISHIKRKVRFFSRRLSITYAAA